MNRIVVCGGCGKMASLAGSYIYDDQSLQLVGIIESPSHPACGKDWGEVMGKKKNNIMVESNLERVIDRSEAVVDFTNPEVSLTHLSICEAYKKAMVIGTTGFTENQINRIKHSAKSIPIVLSPNMALGVNLLFELVRKVSSLLDESYDIEIVETHHRYKKDAPSGTAKKVAEIIAQERKINLEEKAIYGRFGNIGQRREGEIGIHSIRAGNINGEHTIIFNSSGERLELCHKAYGREAFAQGTLKAIHFILNKQRGLFSMKEVLNL
ncbi:MAG: 4-hydroxy-tetrahydrodipicolinate reductase [Atribacterota bacterium]|nr:4-hydroxy-tetrahydrodipicolinate reductase [Atribacterota bacterium]MDD4895165.1 4-hydroxy-tetrahydrodipicolinate reductase [Atribacterota bacterium]MDD5637186.1 4-hydroxy-tetrahydrodipicolinate reductase [Atribacterota bacterium]